MAMKTSQSALLPCLLDKFHVTQATGYGVVASACRFLSVVFWLEISTRSGAATGCKWAVKPAGLWSSLMSMRDRQLQGRHSMTTMLPVQDATDEVHLEETENASGSRDSPWGSSSYGPS